MMREYSLWMELWLKVAADRLELNFLQFDYCDDCNYHHHLSWMSLSFHPMTICYHDPYNDCSCQLRSCLPRSVSRLEHKKNDMLQNRFYNIVILLYCITFRNNSSGLPLLSPCWLLSAFIPPPLPLPR